MIETPQITNSPTRLTACIRLTVPREQIMQVMGPGIQEVMSTLAAQGIAPAGPWLTYHHRPPADVFDFEICVPVPRPVSAAGRVQPGQLPAARVARTIYHGPYEGLPDAWGEFDAWTKSSGNKTGPTLWECYLIGPESSPDPAAWQTELNRPLVA
jgi:effector-binding domain-containing protein